MSRNFDPKHSVILKAIEQAKDGTWEGNVDKNGNVIVHIKGKAFTVTSNNPASIEGIK
tara:strand:- start:236 stop:409 length:174 start_codon:yes stop_codon:yes gene_type:complete